MYPFSCVLWAIFWPFSLLEAKMPQKLIPTHRTINSKQLLKTIAVYHNQIDTNARIKNVEIAIASTHNPLKRILLNIQKMIVRQITSASMRYVCHHSDIYQVLSCSYVELFKRFTGIKSPQKLMVQTNPVTVNSSGYHYSQTEKQKEFKINQSHYR